MTNRKTFMVPKYRIWLLLGDVLTIALLTLIGFATHGELQTSFLARMFTTFLPLLAGWFLIAPWLGLFRPEITKEPRQLWRPFLAMLLAAPIAGTLRAVMLGSVVLPLFVGILGGSAAIGMLIWRAIWLLIHRKR
ncbi:MAG: DUF3054 domain-containing protein [Chloroflexota bacterium]